MSRALSMPILLALALSACVDREEPVAPEPIEDEQDAPEPVSIIRDDVRAEAGADVTEEEGPIRAVIGFPEGGATLDEAALEALDELLDPDWVSGEGPIFLWGHSDTVGSDDANFRAGEARANAVADFFAENGVDADRFRIVSLGEGNPVEPNYLPDGSDNEEGQAANRRVVIQIGDMPQPAGLDEVVDGDEPTP